MRKTILGTAGAALLAALVVAACSHHGADVASTTSQPASTWSAPPGSNPSIPGILPPGATTGPSPGGATAPATAAPGVTLNRSAGRPVLPIEARSTAWITGTVTKGGGGPCYGVRTTAGVQYALYSAQAVDLTAGDRVRVRLTPGKTPVNCGAGKPARLVHLQLAG